MTQVGAMSEIKIRIMHYLNTNREGVSGEKIANYCGVSLGTIRKEISELRVITKSHGIFIQARTSLGYILEIENREKADAFFRALVTRMNSPLFGRQTSRDYKVNYIIRRLLTSGRPIPLDILCSELFYSLSSVRRDLKKVENTLSNFHLLLNLKRGTGYSIEGSELNKRLCLMEQHKLFVNLSPELQKLEPAFIRTFCIGDEDMRRCRHAVRDAIMENPVLSYKILNLSFLTHYIPLIRTRHRYVSDLRLPDGCMEDLETGGIIPEAEQILSAAKREITPDRQDILIYAGMLQALRTVTDTSQLYPDELPQLRKEVLDLLTNMNARIRLFSDTAHIGEDLLEAFMCCWYGIRSRIRFCMIPDEEESRGCNKPDPFSEDLCIEMARYLEKLYGYHISAGFTLPMYYLFQELLDQRIRESGHFSALVISTYGYPFAQFCATLIQRNYGRYISEIDAAEYTQVSTDILEEYDFLITDLRPEFLTQIRIQNTKTILIRIQSLSSAAVRVRELDQFFDDWNRQGREALVEKYSIHASTINEVVEKIADDEQPVNRDGFIRGITRRMYYRARQISNETMFLSVHAPSEKACVRIYDLSKAIDYEGSRIRRMVCCLYNGQDIRSLDLMQQILKEYL